MRVKQRPVVSPQSPIVREPVPMEADLTSDDWGPATSPGLTQLLLNNHSRFLAFLERRVGSRDEAQDILQEAFVRSLERAPPMEDTTSAITWFYRVLRNALTDYYRRQDSRGRAIDRLAAETDSTTERQGAGGGGLRLCHGPVGDPQAGVRDRASTGGARGR